MPHGEAIDCLSLIKSTIDEDKVHTHAVIVFGASVSFRLHFGNSNLKGDLAKKKTYPSLWWLFRDGLLPPETYIVGYARSNIDVLTIRKQSQPYLKVNANQCSVIEDFWAHNFYVQGDYKDPEGFIALNTFIETKWGLNVNRIFYFAIPPTLYTHVSDNIHTHCMPKSFTNQVFGPVWNKEHIANVTISFKEPFGTEGRGGYFDHFGIIRDVVQNHLMQILSLIAMERPRSIQADDIRDEKVSSLLSLHFGQSALKIGDIHALPVLVFSIKKYICT
ncbi:Glucose-6-phosphate 1-dehydrogenase [Fasciolopsis buskii]|uniref:glucose-6-phosphate dehydrogenase (NADP(+)) n=1 Tax=Fasciolopsis buskii TaxID=27845 RepID=A0A8E0VCN7_9TREM|nr:Glucose-6-phosphate 1-dehydrogenase [Fasciolopsis buski]